MRSRLGRAGRGYTRTIVVGVAATGLLIGSLGAAAGQEQDGDAPFGNGTAKATAIVANVAPGVGSLQLGITSGVAVSEIKNTVGQAQAKTLDLGLIGSTLTTDGCGSAVLQQSDLPQALRVDSREGTASAAEDQLPLPGSPIGLGRKEVSASQRPEATAVSTVAEILSDLLVVKGGRAEATTRVIPGEAREARARVSVDLELGGVLQLGSLRWEAFHRTGANPRATADFDLGTAALLGLPIPLDSLAQLEDVLNALLESSGVSISFPKIERFTEPADLIRVSPLRILIKDSPAGGAVLGPILNVSREQREQLFDELSAAVCEAAGALLVADIGVSILAGTGFLAIELGGAEATTGELVLESPFTDEPEITEPVDDVPPPAAIGPLPITPTPGGTPVTVPAAAVGPLEDRCESAHPLRDTRCSTGALMAVGLAGLVATAGVGALDWRHQRKRRAQEVVA